MCASYTNIILGEALVYKILGTLSVMETSVAERATVCSTEIQGDIF